MKKKIGVVGMLLLIGVLLSVGYRVQKDVNNEVYHVIFIPKTKDAENEFWAALTAGARMAAYEYEIDLSIVAPQREEDISQQEKLIYWAIEQKPNAIVIAPADYVQLSGAIQCVKNANIPLIYIDSYTEENLYDTIVATDNYLAGEKCAEIANCYIDEDTKIAVVGHVQGTSTAIERIDGFKNGLGTEAERIVSTVFCDSDFDKAYELTEELMKENPDINIIFGTNEYAAVGAAYCIRDLGLKNKVKMIGFDNALEEVKLLEEGIFIGIVVQKPFTMGYLGVEQTVKLLNGDSFDEIVDSGSELITQKNMYTTENQKLLFPFVGRQFREINFENHLD